mgnify:CR=1 FL=1
MVCDCTWLFLLPCTLRRSSLVMHVPMFNAMRCKRAAGSTHLCSLMFACQLWARRHRAGTATTHRARNSPSKTSPRTQSSKFGTQKSEICAANIQFSWVLQHSQSGQGTEEEVAQRDLKQELIDRERKHQEEQELGRFLPSCCRLAHRPGLSNYREEAQRLAALRREARCVFVFALRSR